MVELGIALVRTAHIVLIPPYWHFGSVESIGLVVELKVGIGVQTVNFKCTQHPVASRREGESRSIGLFGYSTIDVAVGACSGRSRRGGEGDVANDVTVHKLCFSIDSKHSRKGQIIKALIHGYVGNGSAC